MAFDTARALHAAKLAKPHAMGCESAGACCAGCKCMERWEQTSLASTETVIRNGTCGPSPARTNTLPWCKVDARTCLHTPRTGKIASKGPFGLCLSESDHTTIDTRAQTCLTLSHASLVCIQKICNRHDIPAEIQICCSRFAAQLSLAMGGGA